MEGLINVPKYIEIEHKIPQQDMIMLGIILGVAITLGILLAMLTANLVK